MEKPLPQIFLSPGDIPSWMRLHREDAKVLRIEEHANIPYLESTKNDPRWDIFKIPYGEQCELINPSTIMAVVGGSGAGKDLCVDAMVKNIQKTKRSVVVIQADDYYGPWDYDQNIVFNNYDHYDSVDWSLVGKNLNFLSQGYPIAKPTYSFADHRRNDPYSEGGFEIVKPADVIIVVGIMTGHAFHTGDIKADAMVYVHADPEISNKRRIKRDVLERGRNEEQCIRQINDTVMPGYHRFVEPYYQKILNGELNIPAIIIDNSNDLPEDQRYINPNVFNKLHSLLSATSQI